MKETIIAIAFLISNTAFAAKPSQETFQVVSVLTANPEVSLKLKEKNITFLGDVKIEDIEQGVTKFTLEFHRAGCECMPANALVTIVEDMRPTYHDARPEYKTTVEVNK